MQQLTVIADIKAKKDKIDLVRNELVKLIEPTKREAGCIEYQLHQDNKHPEHFLFYENWESKALWEEHMQSQHLADYFKATEGAIDYFNADQMEKFN